MAIHGTLGALSGSIVQTVTGGPFKDEDNLSSDSATHIATQQSIKAYVDTQVTAQDLDFQGDSGGSLAIDLDSESLTIAGTSNEIETAGSGNTITVGLPSNVTIGGTLTATTAVVPDTSGGADLGSASLEWGDVFIADDKAVIFGSDQNVSMKYDEASTDTLLITGGDVLLDDDKKLYFGINKDASFEYDESSTDTLLYAGASLRIVDDTKLEFGTGGDASIRYDESGTDQLRIDAPAAGVVIGGATPKLVIGDGGDEDCSIVFDHNAQDFYIGYDDGDDKLKLGLGAAVGTTPNMELNSADRDVKFFGDIIVGGNDIKNTSGNLTIDSAGNIILDADGGNITLKDANNYGLNMYQANAGDWTFESLTQNKDIIFKVNDSGTPLDVLRMTGIDRPGVIINEGGNQDVDFRIESRNSTHMLYVDGYDDFVGIGVGGLTYSPAPRLHVEHSSNTTAAAANVFGDFTLLLKNLSTTTNAFAGIAFDVTSETDHDAISAAIRAERDTSASTTAGLHDANLTFSTNDAGDNGLTERMRITRDGLVGIADAAPSHTLDVGGDINLTGGFSFDDGTPVTSIDTNISSVSGNDDTLASAKAIKTYVDAQVTAQDLDLTTDSGTIDIDLDSETLSIVGTANEVETSATSTTVTVGLPSNVTIGGTLTATTAVVPVGSGVASLGTTSLEWGHVYIADDKKIYFGSDQDASIEYDEDGTDQLRIAAPSAGVVIAGVTPTLVIGDAGTEDTKIVFDGNAVDYRIGLDDGTDTLEIGVGAAHGTTPAITISSDRDVAIGTNITVGDGNIYAAAGQTLVLNSPHHIIMKLDTDNNGTSSFQIDNGAGTEILNVDESGNLQIDGRLDATSIELTKNGTATAPHIHMHESHASEGPRISWTNTTDTNGAMGSLSHEWTLYGDSAVQGAPTSAQFNLYYADRDGDGTGGNLMTVRGDGLVDIPGDLDVGGELVGQLRADIWVAEFGIIYTRAADALYYKTTGFIPSQNPVGIPGYLAGPVGSDASWVEELLTVVDASSTATQTDSAYYGGLHLGMLSYICPYDLEITGCHFMWQGEIHPVAHNSSDVVTNSFMRMSWHKAPASGGAGSDETNWAYSYQDQIYVGDKWGGWADTYSSGEVYTHDLTGESNRTYSAGEKMAITLNTYIYSGNKFGYRHDYSGADASVWISAGGTAYGRLILFGKKTGGH